MQSFIRGKALSFFKAQEYISREGAPYQFQLWCRTVAVIKDFLKGMLFYFVAAYSYRTFYGILCHNITSSSGLCENYKAMLWLVNGPDGKSGKAATATQDVFSERKKIT